MNEVTGLSPIDYTNSVVYFSAPWCGPCKTLGPLMESMSKVYTNLRFLKVNVDEAAELVAKHKVVAVPTVLLFVNGKEQHSFTGLKSRREYAEVFTQFSGVS
jgi:thioredoxin